MTVVLERRLPSPSFKVLAHPEQKAYLDYKTEYQSFLNWWESNKDQFDQLSFKIGSQTDLFLDQVDKAGIETALSQLRMDLYGYYLEYIRQEGIIPFSLKVNQAGRLVGEFYGDKNIVDMVDEREREGAVKRAMEDLEGKVKNLGEDEIVFRISPSGWTGLAYDYTETQAQVLWRDKKNGKIRGLTIRTQIDLREILAVISSLGVDIPLGLSREQDVIKYITSLNITLPHSPFKFIDFLVEKFNQDHQGRDLASQIEKWWKNDHDFRYFDEIAGLVDFLEKEVKNLVDQGYQGEGLKEHLKSLIGFVLMIMAGVEKEKRDLTEERIFIDSRYLPPGIYDNTFNYLLSLTGCAGGGGSGGFGSFVLTSFGTAAVVENDKYGSREFECPHCHKNVVRPKDKLLEKCPYCGSDVKC